MADAPSSTAINITQASPSQQRFDAPLPSPTTGRSTGGNSHNGSLSHRSSFAENARHAPGSPRQRHPSLTPSAVQELLNHPSSIGSSEYSGRDWRTIKVRELIDDQDIKIVDSETSVEDATKMLINGGTPNVVLVRKTIKEGQIMDTFDYSDLNAYLLVILGLAHPETEEQIQSYTAIAETAREGAKIPLESIRDLVQKPSLSILEETEDLSKATELFAGGVHRVLVTKPGTLDVVGILSQWRLMQFLWENGSSFPVIEQLYPATLRDLNIATPRIISINGDQPLTEALKLMHNESLSSLAVVDNASNVVGNISTVDTRHLTHTSSLPLLKSSCIHFISVILSERGVENGKDSFPVFHVNPYSTLAHTVAKLIATRSHRMWVVESASPSQSTVGIAAAVTTAPAVLAVPNSAQVHSAVSPKSLASHPAISASALPGARISGRLTGVVSLTDVLNLFARQSGLHAGDPNEQRRNRRRSSSISSMRPSLESVGRESIESRK